MSARNILLERLPGPVDTALKALGANLRTARLRRNLVRDRTKAGRAGGGGSS